MEFRKDGQVVPAEQAHIADSITFSRRELEIIGSLADTANLEDPFEQRLHNLYVVAANALSEDDGVAIRRDIVTDEPLPVSYGRSSYLTALGKSGAKETTKDPLSYAYINDEGRGGAFKASKLGFDVSFTGGELSIITDRLSEHCSALAGTEGSDLASLVDAEYSKEAFTRTMKDEEGNEVAMTVDHEARAKAIEEEVEALRKIYRNRYEQSLRMLGQLTVANISQ